MKKMLNKTCLLYHGLALLILFCNTIALLRNGKSYVDGDSASELMLSKLLNEEHRIIFSPNWIYSTELRALNTQFFYRIGMALSSNNWLIARLIAHVLMWVFLIVCFKYFMKQSRIIPPVCISLIAIIAPFSEQYIRYVLYCGYYIPHITLLLLMLALYYKYSEKPLTITLVISLLLAFGAGLGGVRQLLIGYFPLFVTVLLISLNRRRSVVNKSELKNSVWYSRLKYSFYNFLTCGIGWAVNLKVLSRFFTYINTYTAMTLKRMDVMKITNFLLNSVFEILGYEGANEAISLNGIAGLTAMVYAVVILLAIFICVREYKHLSENQQFMVVFFSVCAITYAAFCVLSDFHSVRYMIPSLFCMFVLLDIAIERFFADSAVLKKPVITIGILAICLQVFCNSYIKDFRRIDQIRTWKRLLTG